MLVTVGALRFTGNDTGMELQWCTCGCCVQLMVQFAWLPFSMLTLTC